MNFKYYAIDKDYMDELRKIEPRIPKQDYTKTIYDASKNKEKQIKLYKPFIGIVFETSNGIKYCTQISSAKPKHETIHEDIDFKKYFFTDKNGNQKLIGVVNFNYMFPVYDDVITEVTVSNISNYRDFESQTELSKYWSFLRKQINVINSQSWEDDIKKVYKHEIRSVSIRSFNFEALEIACQQFQKKHNK